ncbi:uncharacterized protein [Periplaneta americana]|uniref:uncharacterized protein n=1 Tax=Periplaneta americana TaxID=6978 RepID=UPI0037E81ECC
MRHIDPELWPQMLRRRIPPQKNISTEEYLCRRISVRRCADASRRLNAVAVIDGVLHHNKAKELQNQLMYHLDVRLPCPRCSVEERRISPQKNIFGEEYLCRRIPPQKKEDTYAEERRIPPQKKEEYLRRRKKNTSAGRIPAQRYADASCRPNAVAKIDGVLHHN